MGARPLYQFATAMLIAFFLTLQVGSALHETHDDDHRGQDCFVCHVVSDEIEALAVDGPVVDLKPKFQMVSVEPFDPRIQSNTYRFFQCRAPPPRGPPATRA